ncbi:C-type lectin BpLec-like [Heteronotia binoei]|uniref:C-type lectin BpLec-like n=1 Tax=Heteronotia binoei TaxID=13085 RepID=UPI00293113DD|nr:C-type lectin BpLec-like [Heteronotia binoei]
MQSNPLANDAGHDYVAARASCHPGAVYIRGYCYEFFSNSLSWDAAEDACQKLGPGSHLASISSSWEERRISTYIRSHSNANCVWIGFYAVPHYNTMEWKWSDQSRYIFGAPLWDKRKPSTSISSLECVALCNVRYPSYSARWYQQNCETPYPYVCKYMA